MREVRANTASNLACEECGATLIYRASAAAILDHFCKGRHNSLHAAVKGRAFDDLHVYEVAIKGPLQRLFKRIPNYTQSYFWEDAALGEVRDGVICQDMTRLTFEDEQFDLVISSGVMEHVPDPWAGFREIHRVLKTGGCYIFTIPGRVPMKTKSVTRATMSKDGEITHILPEYYHKSGLGGKTLVFTDFGNDIFSGLAECGFHTSFERASTASLDANRFGTYVAVKLGATVG